MARSRGSSTTGGNNRKGQVENGRKEACRSDDPAGKSAGSGAEAAMGSKPEGPRHGVAKKESVLAAAREAITGPGAATHIPGYCPPEEDGCCAGTPAEFRKGRSE